MRGPRMYGVRHRWDAGWSVAWVLAILCFVLLAFVGNARGADKPIDPVVAAAWGWTAPAPTDDGVKSGATTWKVTGEASVSPEGTRWVYFPPLGRYAHVHESLIVKEVKPVAAVPFRPAGTHPATPAPSAVGVSIGSPAPAPYREVIYTLVPRGIRGGTVIECASFG